MMDDSLITVIDSFDQVTKLWRMKTDGTISFFQKKKSHDALLLSEVFLPLLSNKKNAS